MTAQLLGELGKNSGRTLKELWEKKTSNK